MPLGLVSNVSLCSPAVKLTRVEVAEEGLDLFGHPSTQPYRNVWITIYPQVTTTVVY